MKMTTTATLMLTVSIKMAASGASVSKDSLETDDTVNVRQNCTCIIIACFLYGYYVAVCNTSIYFLCRLV